MKIFTYYDNIHVIQNNCVHSSKIIVNKCLKKLVGLY